MKYTIKKFIIRNFKRIPYFFTKENKYPYQSNYTLIGKLSTSLLHDILSPLTSLLIGTELSKTQNISSIKPILQHSTDQIKEYVDIMRGFLIDESGIKKKIHINAEIKKCLILLKNKAIQHNVQIQFLEFEQIYTKINPLHIYQIIINLLTNAIESSLPDSSGKIILIIKKQKNTFVIECKDFGVGIPKHIFKKIGSYNFSTKSKERGFGLYSITYLLTHILYGSLSIESEEGSGSLFVCTLPLSK